MVSDGQLDSQPDTVQVLVTPQAVTCIAANNRDHIDAGRAYRCGFFSLYACANGSDDNLGTAGWFLSTESSIEETSPGYWEKVDSCP
jgi:feruloyl esterase